MSDERIDAIRKRLANSYGQSEHFIGMMSDMRYLLDHIATLEARNQALEDVAAAAETIAEEGIFFPKTEKEWAIVAVLEAALSALAAVGEGETDG